MKPLIGITSEFRLNALSALGMSAHFLLSGYTEAIQLAGGLPVVLPIADDATCEETLLRLNGLLLTGDMRDVPPQPLDQAPHPKAHPVAPERWDSDVRWLETATTLGMPVLGICFGMQLLNVAHGGTMFQDILDLCPNANPHITKDLKLDHNVIIEQDSLLASLVTSTSLTVRSTHHQAVDQAAPEFRVVARAGDGVVEAIEHKQEAFILGVQWHPELHASQPDPLLTGFVENCAPALLD